MAFGECSGLRRYPREARLRPPPREAHEREPSARRRDGKPALTATPSHCEDRAIASFDDLPDRIKAALHRARVPEESVVAVLKSSLKPDATIPILWAVVTNRQFLLCCTHARRGIWKTYEPKDINDVRRVATTIEVIPESPDEPFFRLPFPPETNVEQINLIVGRVQELVKQKRA